MQLHIDGASRNTEHYALLSALVKQLPSGASVTDFGTYQGYSACALASNPKVKVFTYDIIENIDSKNDCRAFSNVTFTLASAQNCLYGVLDSSIILLDVSPHDGIQEREVFDSLQRLGFKGLLILDDIHWGWEGHTGMEDFWSSISLKKFDVTPQGHYTGTGIVVFDSNVIDVEVS